jgi:hypothetical protein
MNRTEFQRAKFYPPIIFREVYFQMNLTKNRCAAIIEVPSNI